jgi:iron complex outermembrane recepter protein
MYERREAKAEMAGTAPRVGGPEGVRAWLTMLPVLTALVFIALPAAAQPASIGSTDSVNIDGVVVDAQTGQPLAGALVRVVGLGRQDQTHANGEFHLVNLPAGRHTLLFERIGYRREVREIVAAARERLVLRIEMHPSAIELPGLVVTGTIGSRLGDEAIRPTNVVSGQELLRKMDQTLAASLRLEAGLSASSMGPATARPVIRGLGGDRVLVLEDGARTGDLSAASADHAVAVDPLNAQRLEVVRGPAALLYGSNAIGGVVNIIREEVPVALPDRTTGTISAQGQSVNRGAAMGGTVSTAAGTFALRGEGSFRGTGDLRTPGEVLGNTGVRSYDFALGASAFESWGHLGASYRYYDNAYGVPGGFVGAHPHGVDVEMRRHSVQAQAKHLPTGGPFSAVDATFNYTNYYHRELEDEGIIGTEFGLLTASGQLLARHGHIGRLGDGAFGLRAEWQDFAAGGTGTPPAQEVALAGFFVEEVALGPVAVQFGARYDHHRIEPFESNPDSEIGNIRPRTFGSFSGSIGAHVDAGAWHFGANVARAYRTPSITELFSLGPHLAAYSFEVGNPDLDAEYGLGLDLFARVAQDDLRGEFAVFRNNLSNYIYYANTGQQTGTGLPVYQAVARDARLSGAEAGVEWNVVRNVVVEGVFSYVRGTNRGSGEPLAQLPPLNGLVQLRYERPSYFVGAGWRGAAAQNRVASAEFESPTEGYHIFDALAGYRLVRGGQIHSIALRIENVGDRLYRDHLSRLKSVMPEAGRNVSLTYRLSY